MITTLIELQEAVNNQQEVIEIDGQFDYDLSLITYPCKITGTPGSRLNEYSADDNATFSIELNGWTNVPLEYR